MIVDCHLDACAMYSSSLSLSNSRGSQMPRGHSLTHENRSLVHPRQCEMPINDSTSKSTELWPTWPFMVNGHPHEDGHWMRDLCDILAPCPGSNESPMTYQWKFYPWRKSLRIKNVVLNVCVYGHLHMRHFLNMCFDKMSIFIWICLILKVILIAYLILSNWRNLRFFFFRRVLFWNLFRISMELKRRLAFVFSIGERLAFI